MKCNILLGSLVLGVSLCGQSFGGDLLHRLLGVGGSGGCSSCCDTSVADPSCGCETAPACGPKCAPTCGTEIAAPACDPCSAAPSCGPSCGVESACCGTHRPLLSTLRGIKCRLSNLKGKLACHAPSCGCETAACDPCGAAPACGAAPTCGCEIAAPRCGLFSHKRGLSCAAPTCGCEVAAPACDPCGAAPSCDSGCGCAPKCGRPGILAKLFRHKSCCDSACDAAPSCSSCSSCGSTTMAAPVDAAPAAPAPVVDPHAYLNTQRRVIQASSTRVR